jgi:uncharacterized membrane protein YagU involved in acid resistance
MLLRNSFAGGGVQSKIGAGVAAGVLAGIIFGLMMQMMTAPTPEGGGMSMMVMIAMVVRSKSMVVGWVFHLFVSAVFGAIYGLFLGDRAKHYGSGALYGVAYGIFWWVGGALIAMPVLLGMPPFASLRMSEMRPVAMGSLVGHIIWGVILAELYVRLRRPRLAAVGAQRAM